MSHISLGKSLRRLNMLRERAWHEFTALCEKLCPLTLHFWRVSGHSHSNPAHQLWINSKCVWESGFTSFTRKSSSWSSYLCAQTLSLSRSQLLCVKRDQNFTGSPRYHDDSHDTCVTLLKITPPLHSHQTAVVLEKNYTFTCLMSTIMLYMILYLQNGGIFFFWGGGLMCGYGAWWTNIGSE